MADIFREVDEDLRRDRMASLWRRYGGVLIVGALGIVIGTAGYVGWQRWQTAKHQEQTAALTAALEKARNGDAPLDPAAAATALEQALPGLDGAHATLAQLHRAGLLAKSGNVDAAVSAYDAVAGSASADPLLRDLALMQSVLLQLDSGDPAQLQLRLEPLLRDGNPWRPSAMEASGLLAARAGDTAKAHDLFTRLAQDATTPAGVRSRATDLAALYAQPK